MVISRDAKLGLAGQTTINDTVEAHSCVDIVTKFTDEQYTTINQSTAGRFDPTRFLYL